MKKKRNGEPLGGGYLPRVHIMQLMEKQVYVIAGGSGCTQKVVIGDEIGTMVQVDDGMGAKQQEHMECRYQNSSVPYQMDKWFLFHPQQCHHLLNHIIIVIHIIIMWRPL